MRTAARWVGGLALIGGGPVFLGAAWAIALHQRPAIDLAAANEAVLFLACSLGLIGVHFLPLGWKLRLVIAVLDVPMAAYLSISTVFDLDCRWGSPTARSSHSPETMLSRRMVSAMQT